MSKVLTTSNGKGNLTDNPTVSTLTTTTGLKDSNVTVAIPLGDASNTAFSSTVDATSIVGAINSCTNLNDSNIVTGRIAWSGSGDYWSIDANTFTLLRGGTGYIKGKKITWAGSQNVTIGTSNTTYWIYIDSSGVLQRTNVYNTNLYTDYIQLFEVLILI